MRALGKITDKLELLIEEMVEDHELQRYEIIALVNDYIKVHYPSAIETPIDGGQFILEYKYVKGEK